MSELKELRDFQISELTARALKIEERLNALLALQIGGNESGDLKDDIAEVVLSLKDIKLEIGHVVVLSAMEEKA